MGIALFVIALVSNIFTILIMKIIQKMKEMIKFILTTFFSACKLKLYSSNGKGRGKEGKI